MDGPGSHQEAAHLESLVVDRHLAGHGLGGCGVCD